MDIEGSHYSCNWTQDLYSDLVALALTRATMGRFAKIAAGD